MIKRLLVLSMVCSASVFANPALTKVCVEIGEGTQLLLRALAGKSEQQQMTPEQLGLVVQSCMDKIDGVCSEAGLELLYQYLACTNEAVKNQLDGLVLEPEEMSQLQAKCESLGAQLRRIDEDCMNAPRLAFR